MTGLALEEEKGYRYIGSGGFNWSHCALCSFLSLGLAAHVGQAVTAEPGCVDALQALA